MKSTKNNKKTYKTKTINKHADYEGQDQSVQQADLTFIMRRGHSFLSIL